MKRWAQRYPQDFKLKYHGERKNFGGTVTKLDLFDPNVYFPGHP